ncbi:MAG: hypothetical protein QXV32_05290 [Conexivisphaerales archaeon]
MLEIILSLLSLPVSFFLSKYLVNFLKKRGRTVPDAHKIGTPQVARPGGPAIYIASLVGVIAVLATTHSLVSLAFLLTMTLAFLVGLLDDLKSLSGPLKVLLLFVAPLPILLMHTYTPLPPFPFSGHLRLTDIYPILVLLAIPVTANAFNMIDIYNGLVSGFSMIAIIPLILDFALTGQYVPLALSLALTFSILGFYPFHRYPSKVFPGDSGTLAIGAAYGALAIIGHAEIVAVIALLPSVLNSFFVISSVGGFIEHKEMKKRPVKMRDDMKLEASREKDAPVTLARMILADEPLTERQLASRIILLEAFSSILAFITLLLILVT